MERENGSETEKQGTEGQRCREMDREKVRKTEVPRHIGRNQDRDREMRVREAEI